MIIKLFKFFLQILVCYFIGLNLLLAEEFNFNATEINLSNEGNVLEAKKNVTVTDQAGLIIKADRVLYNKKDSLLIASGNVTISNKEKNIIIKSKKINYNNKSKIIFSDLQTLISINNKYRVKLDDFSFLQKQKKITSTKKTYISDNIKNKIELEQFKFSIKENQISGSNFTLIDNIDNKYYFDEAIIDLAQNEVFAKDFTINFTNSLFGNKNNEPRMKGRAVYKLKDMTIVKKGVFTTCKKRDKCPPWVISADEIKHDKLKKTISYKNAWLKIYDVPAFYFPSFFHPDPTVKRQSGFLAPSITNSSNLGTTINIPYFYALTDNKDFTFQPKIYSANTALIKTEYREVNKNSNHIADFSLSKNNKSKKNSFNSTESHFFSNSKFNLDIDLFKESTLELNLEGVSDDLYLKSHKFDSTLIKNTAVLNNFLTFSGSNDDLYFNSSIEVYENLNKDKNDRFEFIYPNFQIAKEINIDESFNGSLFFDVSGYQKTYDTNVNEANIINNLNFNSIPRITKNGFNSNYKFQLKNLNTNSKNSTVYKDDTHYDAMASFVYKSSLPLAKETENGYNYLTPTFSLMFSPNKTKNLADKNRRIDFNNIFSFNRIGQNDAVEGGQSITLGSKYARANKENKEFLAFGLATVIRNKKDDNLPKTSTLNDKVSNIVGNLNIKPSDSFNINYDFSIENDLKTLNYNLLNVGLNVNNFITEFEFMEESNAIGSDSHIALKSGYQFDDNNSLSFKTRKNNKTNLTEFYNLIYEFKNDCLTAAINYNKDYYTDRTLKPEEQIFFSITIMPFGKISSPGYIK